MKRSRFYAILLRLYPAAFREEYEREMHAAFRRRHRDEPNRLRRAALWLSAVTDVLATAPGEHLDMLMNDIRYSLRTLRKAPAFTAAALITIALGILGHYVRIQPHTYGLVTTASFFRARSHGSNLGYEQGASDFRVLFEPSEFRFLEGTITQL